MSDEIRIKHLSEWDGEQTAHYVYGEAEQALPNGWRVRKASMGEDDATPVGTLGTVVSSLSWDEGAFGPLPPEAHGNPVFYFVVWDNRPEVPVGICAWKVEAV